jgi:hypothetical protein
MIQDWFLANDDGTTQWFWYRNHHRGLSLHIVLFPRYLQHRVNSWQVTKGSKKVYKFEDRWYMMWDLHEQRTQSFRSEHV